MGNGDCSIYKKRYVTIIKKSILFMLVCFYTNKNAFIS